MIKSNCHFSHLILREKIVQYHSLSIGAAIFMHEIHADPALEADFGLVKCIKGFDRIKSDFPDFLIDESKFSARPFDLLFFPKNEAELSVILQEMNRQSILVTVTGARTGVTGGSVPLEGACVSLENLNRIEAVYYVATAGEWRVRLQPAVNLKTLAEFLKTRHVPDLENNPDPEIRKGFTLFKQDPDDYFYPPDPTEMSASIGGTVATNASGARTYRYGPTRVWVRGIRVVLASGEVLDIPRGKYFASPEGQFTIIDSQGRSRSFTIPAYKVPRTKNAAGLFTAPQMDLIDLFIGSEGTLGVITRVDIGLLQRKNKAAMIQFLDSDDQAIHLAAALRAEPRLRFDCLEFYSGNTLDLLRSLQREPSFSLDIPQIPAGAGSALFFEMDFDPESGDSDLITLDAVVSSCGGDMASSWAGFNEREMDRFKTFRHLLPETINRTIAERKITHPGLHKLSTDLAVPDGCLYDMWDFYRQHCEASGLEWNAIGHIGNNHIHVNVIPHDMDDLRKGLELFELFAKKATEMGGTVSAEHGIGKLKHHFLEIMYTPEEIDQMRAVKAAFDPGMILNHGNLFTD